MDRGLHGTVKQGSPSVALEADAMHHTTCNYSNPDQKVSSGQITKGKPKSSTEKTETE